MIKVVFLSSSNLALTTLKSLYENKDIELLCLVSPPPKPQGRGNKIIDSELKIFADKNNIKTFETTKISNDVSLINVLGEMKPDFFVTFSYGQMLSEEVLNIPKYSTLNIHPSLLPKYRGANPIRQTLLNGDSVGGITIMQTELKMDSGDIVIQKEIPLNKDTNIIEFKEIIKNESPNMLIQAIYGLVNNKIKPIKQNENLATFTSKNTKEEKNIDFDCDCCYFHNKIRAFVGDLTCQVRFNNKILKIIKTDFDEKNNENALVGEVLNVSKNGILTKCKTGAILIKTVKPEGKKEMDAYAWSLGSKIKKGDIFEK